MPEMKALAEDAPLSTIHRVSTNAAPHTRFNPCRCTKVIISTRLKLADWNSEGPLMRVRLRRGC